MITFRAVTTDDFSTMNDDALAAAVSTLAAHIHAATWRLLVLIAKLDRREVWAAQGALSCAHWLSWACGIDTHTAREKVRVAHALTALPLLSEALANRDRRSAFVKSGPEFRKTAPKGRVSRKCAGSVGADSGSSPTVHEVQQSLMRQGQGWQEQPNRKSASGNLDHLMDSGGTR